MGTSGTNARFQRSASYGILPQPVRLLIHNNPLYEQEIFRTICVPPFWKEKNDFGKAIGGAIPAAARLGNEF